MTKPTAELIEEAKRLRASGMHYYEIGQKLGRAQNTVFRWLNPDRDADYREKSIKRYGRIMKGLDAREKMRASPREVAARLAEIPPDTRDLTGRVFGDPLLGRRAIDRMKS